MGGLEWIIALHGPGEGPEPRKWGIRNNRLANAPHCTSEKPLTKRQRRRRRKNRKEPT